MSIKHLPHIDLPNHYQFITFRTFASMDGFLRKLAAQSISNDKKQLAMDAYLDSSLLGASLRGEVLSTLNTFFRTKDTLLYDLVAFCIMPNHVHLLLKPYDSLPVVMQKTKGGSAKMINEILGRSGVFWAKDYYDKAIRDERHFSVVYQYIKNNPVKLRDKSDLGLRFYGVYE